MRISGAGCRHTRKDTVRLVVSRLLSVRIACIRDNIEVVRSKNSLRRLCYWFETAAIRRVQTTSCAMTSAFSASTALCML